jgi:hypothetical protein
MSDEQRMDRKPAACALTSTPLPTRRAASEFH